MQRYEFQHILFAILHSFDQTDLSTLIAFFRLFPFAKFRFSSSSPSMSQSFLTKSKTLTYPPIFSEAFICPRLHILIIYLPPHTHWFGFLPPPPLLHMGCTNHTNSIHIALELIATTAFIFLETKNTIMHGLFLHLRICAFAHA